MKTIPRSTLTFEVIVCVTSVALGGCQKRLDLVDTLGTAIGGQQLSIWDHDARELAPIIVVASVEGNEVIAKHVEAARYQGVYLDLHAVRCRRENSLKGGLTEPELRFFYFADGRYRDSKPNQWYKRLFQAEPGSRYLFFLTRERGVLRSIGDVGDYSILVSTGAHPGAPGRNVDIGTSISEILLTPGNSADLNLMAKKVSEYRRIADTWGSRPLTVRLLRRLTELPEPIRSQACGELVVSYRGQDDCLQAMAQDANESSENRQEALREMEKQGAFRQRLLASLNDPATLAYLDWAGDSRHRIREELETILLGTDVALRERACTALRRYYPYDAEPECSGTRGKQRGKQGQPELSDFSTGAACDGGGTHFLKKRVSLN